MIVLNLQGGTAALIGAIRIIRRSAAAPSGG